MKRLILYLLVILFICGCGQKIKALVAISSEKEEQSRFVQAQNNKLALLLKDVKEGNLKKGLTAQQVIRSYGEPVLVKEEKGQEIFLYRNVVEFFPKEKIYLYFDSDNKLSDFVLEETKTPQEITNPE